MRFAGAQIPVTNNLENNTKTIINSINWAEENKCDYLVTPECSLSGYDVNGVNIDTSIKALSKALDTIRKYASDRHIGLILGTLWVDEDPTTPAESWWSVGDVRNQQRYYDPEGNFLGVVNKRYIVSYDYGVKKGENTGIINLPMKNNPTNHIKVTGMICNDLWGGYWKGRPNLGQVAQEQKTDLIIHSSNGAKDKGEPIRKILDKFHTGCLAFLSYRSNIPILTVDNSIHLDGQDYDGETASPSGVFHPLEQIVEAPRKGTQHFYYDFHPNTDYNVSVVPEELAS